MNDYQCNLVIFKFIRKFWKMLNSIKMGFIFMWLSLASGLYVEVDREGFCFQIPGLLGSSFKVFYQSIAAHSNLESNVTTQAGTDEFSGAARQFMVNLPASFCLRASGEAEYVSIDFYPEEQSHFQELALRSQVENLHQQLINVGDQIRELTRLKQFQEQKELIHSEMISNEEQKVHFFTLLKVGLIVVILLGQLWLLLKKNKSSN